jgi:hypothetical protein
MILCVGFANLNTLMLIRILFVCLYRKMLPPEVQFQNLLIVSPSNWEHTHTHTHYTQQPHKIMQFLREKFSCAAEEGKKKKFLCRARSARFLVLFLISVLLILLAYTFKSDPEDEGENGGHGRGARLNGNASLYFRLVQFLFQYTFKLYTYTRFKCGQVIGEFAAQNLKTCQKFSLRIRRS